MRLSLIVLFLILSAGSLLAQGEANSLKDVPVADRIVTGGGFGLGFGQYQDFVSVSPIIGYSLTRKFLVGSGFTYRYTKYKYVTPNVSFNDYSINPFARFNIYQGFFVQTEYEYLNYEFLTTPTEKSRQSFESFLAGGGLIQPVGNRAALFIMALYNFSYTASTSMYTPYASPWVIRAGVNVGGFIF
ncbi:MAG: hypothetical protein MUE95_00210 [Cyclobacteriaceae bacterium]|jgi:hypothetical protein|nr:hypothetical protein [Cyclobacteriaceae bacterium]